MMELQDQLQRTIKIPRTPKRIISLVPSQTELLIDLGLKENLVGITKFCVHPKNLRKEKTIVGGTKQVKLEKIRALHPDIILCNKEENTPEMVVELEKIASVHVSDIHTLEDTFEMIGAYGRIFSKLGRAAEIIADIRSEFTSFQHFIEGKTVKKAVYFIWKDPWMAAGANTFIDYLLQLNKLENAYSHLDRYPKIELEDLKEVDLILLSSEPFPFQEKHKVHFEGIIPPEKIHFVNGEYFSWYGTRLLGAFRYFRKLAETIR